MHLQNHLRTTVKGLGQIEIDEIYAGIDRHGCQYIIPVQAKGGSDKLATVQAKQDIACCAQKFPGLVCRAISAQFMDDSLIAIFELCLDNDDIVRVVNERHNKLVPASDIDDQDRPDTPFIAAQLRHALDTEITTLDQTIQAREVTLNAHTYRPYHLTPEEIGMVEDG